MASVDDRIVAMQFDNNAFESKLATTTSSLGKLKSSLDFSGAKRGMEDLTTASHGFSLEGIGSAVEGISNKFSAMGAVAFTIISNITTHAIEAGAKIAKSLSLDQIISGFQEYEQNMNAIQTVLANTKSDGTTLNDVNKALDILNQYSDQTIYNFGEMTKNIGTFTAAGVNLETSTAAIKGIANLAAISGSNSQQASTAMYQLSQALAAGKLTLMDWNSIVNAGMGGEVFQKSLFETGKALKTIKGVPIDMTFEQWTAAGNTFRGSLESGWLTSKVLTNTLQGFTGDLTEAQVMSMGYTKAQTAEILEMGKTGKEAATKVKTLTQLVSTVKESIGSGWSETFKIVLGDFAEAKDLFTGISNTIGTAVGHVSDARNNLLKGWHDLGGRTALLEGFRNVFIALAAAVKPIKEAFRNIFPPMTAQTLYDLTERFHQFTATLKPSATTIDLIKRIFTGLFSAFSIGMAVVKGIAGFFGDLFGIFAKFGGGNSGILTFLASLGDKVSELKTKLVDGGVIAHFFENLAPIIEHFVRGALIAFDNFMVKVREVVDYFTVGFKGMSINSGNDILRFANRIGTAVGIATRWMIEFVKSARLNFDAFKAKVAEVIDYFTGGFNGMWTNEGEGINLFANKVGTAVGNIKTWISGLFDGSSTAKIDDVDHAFGRLGQRFGWLGGVGTELGKVWDFIVSHLDGARSAVSKVASAIKESFKDVPQAIANVFASGDYSQILDTLNVGLFAGLILMIKKFLGSASNLGGIFKNVSKSFEALTGTLQAMQTNIKAEALMKIAAAVAILVAAMLVLSLMDSAALTKSLVAMSVGFAQLVGVMALLDQVSSGVSSAAQLTILSAGLILLSVAVLVLSLAVKNIATMDWEQLAKGLSGVTAMLGIMVIAVQQLDDNSSGMIRAGIGMIAIAIALNIMALAVKSFAEMSWEEMGKGLAGVGTGLLLITTAVKNMPDGMIAKGLGLMAIAVALNILALAVKSFAEMNWTEMGKGLAGVGGGLLLITTAMDNMPDGMLTKSVGLIAVAVALNILALAVKSFATMNWTEMGKGLAGVGGSLLIIAGAMQLMPGGISMTLQGAGLMMVGLGLISISKAIQALGGMSWENMAKGLTGIAATLAILAIASYAMEGSIGGALAIAIMSVSLGKMAEALKLFGTIAWSDLLKGLVAIAAVLAVLGISAALISPVIPALLALGVALILIGAAFALFGVGANLVATAFAVIATAGTQGVAVLMSALQGLIEKLPALIVAVGDGVLQLADKIIKALPKLIEGLSKVISALLQLLIDNIPKLGETLTKLFLEALKMLEKVIPQLITTGLKLLMELLRGIRDNIAEVTKTVVEIILNFIESLTQQMPQIVAKGAALLVAFLKGIADNIASVVTAGISIVVAILQGISQSIGQVVAAVTQVVVEFIKALGDMAVDLISAGKDFIIKIIEGMASAGGEVAAAAAKLITDFFAGIALVAAAIIRGGKDLIITVIEGMASAGAEVAAAAAKLITSFFAGIALVASTIIRGGKDLIITVIEGMATAGAEIAAAAAKLITAFFDGIGLIASTIVRGGKDLMLKVIEGMGTAGTEIATAAAKLVTDFFLGIGLVASAAITGGRDLIITIVKGMATAGVEIANAAGDALVTFLNGLADAIRSHNKDIRQAGIEIGKAIISGMTFGLVGGQDEVVGIVGKITKASIDKANKDYGVASPSKVFRRIGERVIEGLTIGLSDSGMAEKSMGMTGDRIVYTLQNTLSKIPSTVADMSEFNPTITPVLDLTNVQREAARLGGMLGTSSISAAVSYTQAALLSTETTPRDDPTADINPVTQAPVQMKFEQNNYSPTALSTADIYRQTKNQIALAKKELAVL